MVQKRMIMLFQIQVLSLHFIFQLTVKEVEIMVS